MSEKAFCSQVLLQSDFKHNDKFTIKIVAKRIKEIPNILSCPLAIDLFTSILAN